MSRRSRKNDQSQLLLILLGALGLGVIVIGAVGAAFVLMQRTSAKPKKEVVVSPEPPQPAAPAATPLLPAAPAVPPLVAASPPVEAIAPPALPQGWSYNKPTHGFRAAWPVAAGPDGFTPQAAWGNIPGHYQMMNESTGIGYGVAQSDLSWIPGAAEIEPLALVDRFLQRMLDNAAKRGRDKPENLQRYRESLKNAKRIAINGVPGREVSDLEGLGLTRYVAIGGTIYILNVNRRSKGDSLTADDPQVKPFFDAFAVVK